MQRDHTAEIADILHHPAFKKAVETLDIEHERTVSDIITLTEIPSPPFKEDERGAAYLDMLRTHGLDDVERDEIGNVMGVRRGIGNGALTVVAAHLDTVFPEGTDVKVRREGTKLYAPGVGDDTRSLAVLLAFLRAMDAAKIRTRNDILFVGDVGEEGLGDLRGVRHLFTQGKYRDKIETFITVDSPEMEEIVTGGVGSKRYSVRFRGPGGHSFKAFGIVNPMYAMAQAVVELGRIQVPAEPPTTFCASIVGGGTSINAIPDETFIEIDLRSESAKELARLDERCREIMAAAVAQENAIRSTKEGAITLEIKPVGDRPAGGTPLHADIDLEGGTLGEIFTFLSGLYFRGKMAYANAFAQCALDQGGAWVITPNRGLLAPGTLFSLEDLRGLATTGIHPDDPAYCQPLLRSARKVAAMLTPDAEVVLLGSIATDKYVQVLAEVFGERLRFPTDFVGRGDMSRGGLMLRCAREGNPLEYIPVSGAIRHGKRPPKLEKISSKIS